MAAKRPKRRKKEKSHSPTFLRLFAAKILSRFQQETWRAPIHAPFGGKW